MMGMVILIVGVLLWSGAHLFKRIAPGLRARMEPGGRAPIALILVLSVVLMVIGYRMADGAFFWGRHPATVGLNNLAMLLSIYLFAVAGMKTALARRMRHPMLAAVKTWAIAHLLVNGDVPSFVLFGGLLAWAVVEVIVINRTVPDWTPPPAKPARKEVIAVAATLVLYAAFCHKVTEALNNGWALYGGPTQAYDQANGVMRCGQAVTKDAPGEYSPDIKLGAQ